MDKLAEARAVIDKVDGELSRLFAERMGAVEQVAAYKQAHGLPVFDGERERRVLEKNTALVEPALREDYRVFLQEMMELSKRRQRRLLFSGTAAYQGVEGAYSHIALSRLFPDAPQRAFETWDGVFRAVEEGEAAFGVVPFENSYTGEVGEVLDLLYRYDLHITGIYDLRVSHCLLALPGAKLSEIESVYSHPQALSQCKHWLDGRGWTLIPWLNTAAAAKQVSEGSDLARAAIASRETAELYGLDILAEELNTSAENTTRFIVLEKELRRTGNRFNLLFTLDHKAGSLAEVMAVIARYGFNMECIRSQPLHNLPWQYYFYVELCGDAASPKAEELLREMKERCGECKLLGCYEKQENGC